MNTQRFDLDTPLMTFRSKTTATNWTIRDAVEGVQIFGGIGSGKTSGSGRTLALKYLSNDFGGLVLTVKADERRLWESYCRQTGRAADLRIIEPGGRWWFNFLDYESSTATGKISLTENVVQVLKTVIRAGEEKKGGKADDPFWEDALDLLIFNVVDLCRLAYGRVSIQEMYDIVMSAPKAVKDKNPKGAGVFYQAYDAAQGNVNSELFALIDKLPQDEKERIKNPAYFDRFILDRVPNSGILKTVYQFFSETYRNLSEKTRSIIEFSFSSFLFRLLKEPFFSLFGNGASTVTPEDSLSGKIIIIDLPVKLYNKVGRDAQVMFKYIWQRAMEKRDIRENERPVFLWADEAQNFLHEYDADYQATARGSRIATVYLSQNLPNYHANMGGTRSEYRVKSFLGTLGTKIFHANADLETNRYASDLIGEGYTEDEGATTTIAGNFSMGRSVSYKLEKMVRPEELVGLKTGSPMNDFTVEAYMHLQGKAFDSGLNHQKLVFKQQQFLSPLNPTP